MKIKNVALALAGAAVSVSGLMSVATLAADSNVDKKVSMDPSNAVQHMVNVKLIGDDGNVENASTLKLVGKNLVGVETNNFVIAKDKDSNKIEGGNNSNILGGISNIVNGSLSTILGGESNKNNGNYSTILGGKDNKIGENGVSEYSTIVGGTSNGVNGNYSAVVGGSTNGVNGDHSAVVGNNTKVNGNNSVALGKNSKNNANNSFLWTDGNDRPALEKSNVFAVRGEHGMVVNASQAHPLAQLTIGGPLVIHKGDSDLQCTESGVVKVVDGDSGYKCFCSCGKTKDNEYYWYSLYGQGRCEGKCNMTQEHEPGCGTETVTKTEIGGKIIFEGSCNKYSKPVLGYGAYVVDSAGKIHWTCQTDAGKVTACEAFSSN